MCGLIGLVFRRPEAVSQGIINDLTRHLEHRGPDDQGIMTAHGREIKLQRTYQPQESEVLLIHRRLSIIDLSEAGWQPMASRDRRYFIVFNGEIYNYLELRRELESLGCVFRSQSDTEVLLNACAHWGTACLDKLVGMFSFAFFDSYSRKMLLARDFFGIKPLYYTSWQSGLAFASEIKLLLRLPGVKPRGNPERVYQYLRFGMSDHGGETLFSGIHQLPAAHFLEIDLDNNDHLAPVRYWKPEQGHRLDLSFEEAAKKLRELFLESVSVHLRSDVAVGVALSGGIDSSSALMVVRYLKPGQEIHACSYLAKDPSLNEEKWVELVGRAARANLHKSDPVVSEFERDLDNLIYIQEEPFSSTSVYAQHCIFRLAKKMGLKVMLSGQGADEILGGYPQYIGARMASLLRGPKLAEALKLFANASRLPGRSSLMMLAWTVSSIVPARFHTLLRFLSEKGARFRWLRSAWFRDRGVSAKAPEPFRGPEVLLESLVRSLSETSLPRLLRFEDRNSMCHSVENRVPFLTPKLVNFMHSLPEHYFIAPDGTTKWVFRKAMRGIVPDAILDRKDKIAFNTPERDWLIQLKPWVEATLSSEIISQIPLLDHKQIRGPWQRILSSSRSSTSELWRLTNLIAWTRRFEVSYE
jgi:asparagine synthase (glutamine-hydrolysing)